MIQHKRQDMESLPFPADRECPKRRKIELSPTDSGFGDTNYTDVVNEIELYSHYNDGESAEDSQDSLLARTSGSELEDFDSDFSDRLSDSELLDSLPNPSGKTEPVKSSKYSFKESTYFEPLDSLFKASDRKGGRKECNFESSSSESTLELMLLDYVSKANKRKGGNKKCDSENSFKESTYFEPLDSLSKAYDRKGGHKKCDSENSFREPIRSESLDSNAVVSDRRTNEKKLSKKCDSEFSGGKSANCKSLKSDSFVEEYDRAMLMKISLFPGMSLNDYLWLGQFNDDSSYQNNAHSWEELEQQQFQQAVQNSLAENAPVNCLGSSSGGIRSGENGHLNSYSKNDDFVFSLFNVSGDFRTSQPHEFKPRSLAFAQSGRFFIGKVLKNMNATLMPKTRRTDPEFDKRVRREVLAMKEGMRFDKSLQIYFLATCLLHLFQDMSRQARGVFLAMEKTVGELDRIFDKMCGLSPKYNSCNDELESHLFSHIIEFFDSLQCEVFTLQEGGSLMDQWCYLIQLANDVKCFFSEKITAEDSEERFSTLVSYIRYLSHSLVQFSDWACFYVKRGNEFYRVRNYVVSRERNN